MTSDPAISVRGLSTRFGSTVVHDGLDLDVARGEILAVIGPSGCGKSVLLREIIGLEKPSAGTITIAGGSGETERQRARGLGVMFQDGALFSKLTLRENVEAPYREHTAIDAALRAELAGLKLVMAGLEPDTHDLKPAQISGGMRKRAALARAIALDPHLLLLDEPTSGLDPVTASRFDALVRELAAALDLTVFLVTHDLNTLFATADRVAVLHGGKVAAIGTIEEVCASDHPWIRSYFHGPRGRGARLGAGRAQ